MSDDDYSDDSGASGYSDDEATLEGLKEELATRYGDCEKKTCKQIRNDMGVALQQLQIAQVRSVARVRMCVVGPWQREGEAALLVLLLSGHLRLSVTGVSLGGLGVADRPGCARCDGWGCPHRMKRAVGTRFELSR